MSENKATWMVTEKTMYHVESWNAAIEAAAKLIEYPAEDGKMYAATIRTLKK